MFQVKNKFIIFSLLITTIALPSMFVNDSTDHVIISGSYESESDPSGTTSEFRIQGEYVFYGNFSLGVSFLSGSYEAEDSFEDEQDYDVTGYGLNMSYHIKDSPYPVDYSLSAGYSGIELNSDFLDAANIQATGTSINYGLEIYKSIIKRDSFELIPFVGLFGLEYKAEVKDGYGNSVESNDESTIFKFGLGIKAGNAFIVPAISQNDGDSNFNITFGMLLPQPKN